MCKGRILEDAENLVLRQHVPIVECKQQLLCDRQRGGSRNVQVERPVQRAFPNRRQQHRAGHPGRGVGSGRQRLDLNFQAVAAARHCGALGRLAQRGYVSGTPDRSWPSRRDPRRAEAAGLEAGDTVRSRNGWAIEIKANEIRGLKHNQSGRMLPVRPEVLGLNFLDYVEKIRSLGSRPLLPELVNPYAKGTDPGDRVYKNFIPLFVDNPTNGGPN